MDASLFKDIIGLLVIVAVGYLMVKFTPNNQSVVPKKPVDPKDWEIVTVEGGSQMPRQIAIDHGLKIIS